MRVQCEGGVMSPLCDCYCAELLTVIQHGQDSAHTDRGELGLISSDLWVHEMIFTVNNNGPRC